MRIAWVLPLAAALLACTSETPEQAEAPAQAKAPEQAEAPEQDEVSEQTSVETPPNTQSLIASDDPRGCAASDAIGAALSAAHSQYGEALLSGMPAIRTNTVSATGINKDIHELTCSATGHARGTYTNREKSFPIVYRLRPALDHGGGFIAEIATNQELNNAVLSHIYWWRSQNTTNEAEEGRDEVEWEPAKPDTTTASSSTE